jgi:hypothetical protein
MFKPWIFLVLRLPATRYSIWYVTLNLPDRRKNSIVRYLVLDGCGCYNHLLPQPDQRSYVMESMMRQAPFVCPQRHRCCHPDCPSTRSRSTYVLPTGALGSLTRGLVAHASTIGSTLVEPHPSLPRTAIAAPRIGHPPVTPCRPSLGD